MKTKGRRISPSTTPGWTWSRPVWQSLVATLVLGLVIGVVGLTTQAWFMSQQVVVNRLDTAMPEYAVDLVDVFTPPTGPVQPGRTIDKVVGATNQGNQAAFVRLLVWPVIVSQDGQPLPATVGDQLSFIDLNETDWMAGGDGYYYFRGRLEPGATTPPLFTGVQVRVGLEAAYAGAHLTIEVKTEATEPRVETYRTSWWGSPDAPSTDPLRAVDDQLKGLAS
jgi:alternate signal-mediated exported protein